MTAAQAAEVLTPAVCSRRPVPATRLMPRKKYPRGKCTHSAEARGQALRLGGPGPSRRYSRRLRERAGGSRPGRSWPEPG
jgi:hypothetical protein